MSVAPAVSACSARGDFACFSAGVRNVTMTLGSFTAEVCVHVYVCVHAYIRMYVCTQVQATQNGRGSALRPISLISPSARGSHNSSPPVTARCLITPVGML